MISIFCIPTKSNKEYIYLSNLGYNFFRIILFYSKKKKILTISFNKISFLKNNLYGNGYKLSRLKKREKKKYYRT